MHLDDLVIYKDSMDLATDVYNRVAKWQSLDRETLGKQMIRAADSVPSNIAEGYGRYSGADNRRFILYARGSLFELRAQIELAHRRRLIRSEEIEQLKTGIDKLLAQLIAYSRSIPSTKA
jgi:four helix bundle protein